MKKFILTAMSLIIGVLVPVVVAYNMYASPVQKNAMPIWLLTIIGLVTLGLLKLLWSWLVNSSSMATRILLIFGVLDFLLIKGFYILRSLEAGEIVISNNILFLVGTTTVAGLFSVFAAFTSDKEVDVDLTVDKPKE